tara:strand:- start:5480 stop:6304 length:825 start_codon:yes stop_codon:yes gene_type:complete
MSSKVNYGKYRVNTDGLVFRVDGYSHRSREHNSEYWRDLTPSGIDVKLENSGLYDETSGYYKFRAGASNNTYAAVSGDSFTDLTSLGVFKDNDSSFTIEAFFQIKTGKSTESDDGAVIFGNTDHNKSGYSYGFVVSTGEGGGVSGLNAVLASVKSDEGTNHPWTGITGVLSDPSSPSVLPDNFYHAAMTYSALDGLTVSYLNGVAKNSEQLPNDTDLMNGSGLSTHYDQLYIGGNSSSGINVDIGMVSAYNRALSSGEVFGNCQSVKHRYGGGY